MDGPDRLKYLEFLKNLRSDTFDAVTGIGSSSGEDFTATSSGEDEMDRGFVPFLPKLKEKSSKLQFSVQKFVSQAQSRRVIRQMYSVLHFFRFLNFIMIFYFLQFLQLVMQALYLCRKNKPIFDQFSAILVHFYIMFVFFKNKKKII